MYLKLLFQFLLCLAIAGHYPHPFYFVYSQPFWPTGSGCARGFLGVMDTAWLILRWFKRALPELQLIAEREGTFQILPQTEPQNLAKTPSK